MATDRSLRGLAVVPLAISVVVYSAVLGLATAYAPDLLESIWQRPDAIFWRVLWYALLVVGVVALIVVGMLLFTGVTAAISGPFYEKMAERVLTEQQVALRPRPFLRAAMVELIWALSFTAAWVVSALLSLIPGVGVVFGPVTIGLGMLGLASSALGPALSATGRGFRERLSFAVRSVPLLLGVGLVVSVAMLVPILGLVAFPAAVIGGTELLARRGLLSG